MDEELRPAMGTGTVHVTIPAEVAFNLDHLQKVQKDILGRLGCQACCSGFDIRFDIAKRFIVDKDLQVRTLGEAG